MTRQELKARAKEQLKGNLGSLIVIFLIFAAVSYLPNLIAGIGTIVSIVVVPALTLAMTIIYLKLMDSTYLKMLSALVVALFLAVPYWKKKYFSKPHVKKEVEKNA